MILDSTDLAILGILQKNALATLKDISAEIIPVCKPNS